MFDLGWTQRQGVRGAGPEQLQADRSIGPDQQATSSTGRRRGYDGAGHRALLRPVVFAMGSTQWQVTPGLGPEQLQADRSIGFDQLASSSTRRRRGHGEAGHDALLRPVMFDLESTQRQVFRGSGPEQQQADRSIGLDQLAASSTRCRRGHGEAGHGALLRPVVFDFGSTQRPVVRGSGPEQLQAERSIWLAQLATSSTWRRRGYAEAGQGALLRPVVFALGST